MRIFHEEFGLRRSRIGLALSAFAAVAVSLAGSPLATADIQAFDVNATDRGYDGGMTPWSIDVRVTCDPTATPIAPSVYLTDNGASISGSPLAAGNRKPMGDNLPANGDCYSTGTQNVAVSEIAYMPRTPGAHHLVATQYKPDGSVLSTVSRDVNVTASPCTVIGSVAIPFSCMTGSSGS